MIKIYKEYYDDINKVQWYGTNEDIHFLYKKLLFEDEIIFISHHLLLFKSSYFPDILLEVLKDDRHTSKLKACLIYKYALKLDGVSFMLRWKLFLKALIV